MTTKKQAGDRTEGRLLLFLLGLSLVVQVFPIYTAAACNPNFTLSVSPNSSTIQKGLSERLTLTVTGTCGLNATVNVGYYTTSPSNGPILTFHRYDIHVSPTAPTGTALITVGTTSTPKGTYTITTTGKGVQSPIVGVSHSTSFSITVM